MHGSGPSIFQPFIHCPQRHTPKLQLVPCMYLLKSEAYWDMYFLTSPNFSSCRIIRGCCRNCIGDQVAQNQRTKARKSTEKLRRGWPKALVVTVAASLSLHVLLEVRHVLLVVATLTAAGMAFNRTTSDIEAERKLAESGQAMSTTYPTLTQL